MRLRIVIPSIDQLVNAMLPPPYVARARTSENLRREMFVCQILSFASVRPAMNKHKASHFDHNLTAEQVAFAIKHFANRSAFFAESVEMPDELGVVPCGLHGPLAGDAPVLEEEAFYERRGERAWMSRLVDRAPRLTRTITVIAGPYDEHPCIVYTIYGGPLAPQEPGDPECRDVAGASAFWSAHALSR